ncbi:MAG: hypothetical protein HY871_07620 [Chloroflexi bacterium]|nr:hypothetical protein [Chloroflexota bacterium]
MTAFSVLLSFWLAGCELPGGPGTTPLSFYALRLPATAPLAYADGRGLPDQLRSLRLTFHQSPEKKTQVLFWEYGQGTDLEAGHSLGMAFRAPQDFRGVAAFLESVDFSAVRLDFNLRRGGLQGEGLARGVLTMSSPRGWVELTVPSQPPGQYYLEIAPVAGQASWWGQSLVTTGRPPDLELTAQGVPLRVGEIPLYHNTSYEAPVGLRAERVYFLGGTSTFDHGVGWWDAYDAYGDTGDRQFVGDQVGEVRVIYQDGQEDPIPLVFGWNLWWYNYRLGPEAPYPEPFASDPEAKAALDEALRLYPAGSQPALAFLWSYTPRPKVIRALRFVDNPRVQGFPLFSAVTIQARAGLTGDSIVPLKGSFVNKEPRLRSIVPEEAAGRAYETPLRRLRPFLYTAVADLPASVPLSVPENFRGPRVVFKGNVYADILTNVYFHSQSDLLSKIDGDGTFHTSTAGSPNWSWYQGNGTWKPNAGSFYDQAWSRDMGRALLELLRLGYVDEADKALRYADSHLYDLPRGYPKINRDGQRVPAHWGTVVNIPNFLDIDRKGDDNQENDGHGLLLLAHYQAWLRRNQDLAWLKERWPFIADAAEWYCFQLDNPAFSRAKDVLYTESESAHDGGYDVYSNYIALQALKAARYMAFLVGDTERISRWTRYIQPLEQGISASLTEIDPRFGITWRAVAWNWGYAHESLGPINVFADVWGYEPSSVGPPYREINANTYRRQLALPSGTNSARALGYGQGFITQAALLMDDMANATWALENLAKYSYYPRHRPYVVPEGVAVHPSGAYWYRTGDLGNAVQEAEVLKAISLVAGVDLLGYPSVRLLPRLPLGWSQIRVEDFPLVGGPQPTLLSYTLERQSPERLSMRVTLSPGSPRGLQPLGVSSSSPVANLDIRLGPLPAGAKDIVVTKDGVPAQFTYAQSGGWGWVWLRGLRVITGTEMTLSWKQ